MIELGWYTEEVIVMYLECKWCRKKGSYMKENRGQEVLKEKTWEKTKWCGCPRKNGRKKAACPREGKAQQGSAQTEALKSAAKEGGGERDVKRTLKPLRDVWLTIGIEKIDTHEGVTVKALLDCGATEMFMDKRIAAKHRFRLQRLEQSLQIKNIDGVDNSGGMIMHQVEVNVYYQNHVERIRMDVVIWGEQK